MNSLLFVATALISVISANRVIHLTGDNFDSIVDGTRNVFVKFEASWCGPCKRMAPIMDRVAAESFPNLDGDTILASIDADAHREIGDRFEIEAFPTIKLFLKGRNLEDAVEFEGDRSLENISKFIKTQTALNHESLTEEFKQLQPQMPLTQLLQQLSQVPARPQVLKNAVINMNNFAAGFMDESDDSDNYYKASTPAQPQQQQQQQQKNLKQKKIKTRKDKTRSRKQVTNIVAIKELLEVNADEAQAIIKSAGPKPVILIFFSLNCPHCREFVPLAQKYSETRSDAIFLRINGDENVSYRDSFNLRYYPSIIGFYANSNGARYELMASDRGFDYFNSFVNKLTKH